MDPVNRPETAMNEPAQELAFQLTELAHPQDLAYRPEVLDPTDADDRARLHELASDRVHVVDTLGHQLHELAEVDALTAGDSALLGEADYPGTWVYYPWHSTLVHVLDEPDYIRLRSSRNAVLISAEEQATYAGLRIGAAGLNVGNPAVICMVLENGPRQMKLADFDPLSVSNLNRYRRGITDLGINKAVLTAREVAELDPFVDVELYDEGLTPETVDAFLLSPRVDVVIEEMDNLPLKVLIRERARAHGIPVVMVTGNGDGCIVDIERYDVDPELPLLCGFLPPAIIERIKTENLASLPLDQKVQLARDFMGAEYLTPRLREAFLKIGTELAGIPQVATSSFIRGAAVSYVVRQIASGSALPSGRYRVQLDELASSVIARPAPAH
jgi:hypothetical protein